MYELQRIYRKSSKGNRKPHWEATILFHKVTKNNGVTKDCFLIRENGYDVSPSVYLEDYYHAFRDGSTIPELAEKVQHIYQECKNNTSLDAGHFLKFDNIKNEIFCKIIGRGRNENCLRKYRIFLIWILRLSFITCLRMRCLAAEVS